MFLEILNLCFQSFKTHKIRSFLSALGVFFGVGAVIGMLSIGEGARKEVLNLIKMMGEKHIIIKISKSFQENNENQNKTFYGLNFSDLRILKEGLPDIKALSPSKKLENIEIYSQNGEKTKGNIFAVQKEYKELLNLPLSSGRFFLEEDERECFQVCVIGKGIALKLYGSKKPEGEKIKILNQWYTIVGVVSDLKSKKGKLEGLEAEEYDKTVYIPLRTFLLKEGVKKNESTFDEIAITLSDLKGLKVKKIYLEKLFKRLHQKAEDVEVVVPLLILKQKQETQRIFNIVMACIAGISLLVGGIGIMNIMLASVLERIREIGLRRAVGARKKDIMLQFLLEASFISGIGGIAGIILGFLIAYSVSFFAKWTTTVPLWSIFLSFGISIAVGIIFGYWPSKKGAEANPIEALRYEA
jgi:putative ABC transport system permease protein